LQWFSTPERLAVVRRVIGAIELGAGDAAAEIAELEAFQRADFEAIFEAAGGRPVTVRLLDPPLHEFLPKEGTPELEALCDALAAAAARGGGAGAAALEAAGGAAAFRAACPARLAALAEANPMMGLRGCRLGIVRPKLTTAQTRAAVAAALAVSARPNQPAVQLGMMAPLVAFAEEFSHQARVVRAAAAEAVAAAAAAAAAAGAPPPPPLNLKIGTMIGERKCYNY
jgi:pyruvate,orthophosphate dikinase